MRAAAERPSALMTFNLRRATRLDGPNDWPHRRDSVAETVLAQAPDVLATQEGLLPQLRDLDERLPGYERVGGARERWPEEEPNALYYDLARVRVLDAGELSLSRAPLRLGLRGWGAYTPRTALWALLLYVETMAPLLVVNTHLDHLSVFSRRASAFLLQRLAPHAVMMGDFNALPRRLVHRVLLQDREDPLEGARPTHNAFTRRDRGRIDWILVPRGLRVRKATVLAPRRPDGGPVSDHLPVVVDVEPPIPARPISPPRRTWTRDDEVPAKLPPRPEETEALARALAARDARAAPGAPPWRLA